MAVIVTTKGDRVGLKPLENQCASIKKCVGDGNYFAADAKLAVCNDLIFQIPPRRMLFLSKFQKILLQTFSLQHRNSEARMLTDGKGMSCAQRFSTQWDTVNWL